MFCSVITSTLGSLSLDVCSQPATQHWAVICPTYFTQLCDKGSYSKRRWTAVRPLSILNVCIHIAALFFFQFIMFILYFTCYSPKYEWLKAALNCRRHAHMYKHVNIMWASPRENLSLGFQTKRVSNQSLQLQRLARNFARSKSRYDTSR